MICDDIEVTLGRNFQDTNIAPSAKLQVNPTAVSYALNKLSIYPNPTNGLVHITLPSVSNTPGTIYISDKLGRVLKTMSLEQATNQPISTTEFSNGIYQVILVVDGQVMAKDKLVVIQ